MSFPALRGRIVALGLAALVISITPRAASAQAPMLPRESTPDVDAMLDELERSYAAMDVDGFVSLFTDDFVQHDVNRRVLIKGIEAWRQQTEIINSAHRALTRVHHGRVLTGKWLIVEVEWTGTVIGEAIGAPEDRDYSYHGVALLELAGGRIRRQLIYSDHVTLIEQLGVGQ